MSIVTNTNLPVPVQTWFDDLLLARPEPYLIFEKCAMRKRMPAKSGTHIRFRRYNTLARATVPLGTSSITPPPQNLSALDIDARIDFYGTYVIISDQVTLQHQDPVLNETTSLLSQSLRESENILTKQALESTASFVNCVNGTNGDSPTNLTRQDINEVVFALIGNSGRMVSEMISGQDKFGTTPIRQAYMVMAHSDVLTDLENVQGFINAAQYPTRDAVTAEWGSVGNSRWMYSPLGSKTDNASLLGVDIYNNFFTAKNAYATVELDGASAKFIYQGFGSGNDPLLQRQTVGYKFAKVSLILNDSWIMNLRSTLA